MAPRNSTSHGRCYHPSLTLQSLISVTTLHCLWFVVIILIGAVLPHSSLGSSFLSLLYYIIGLFVPEHPP